MTLDLPLLEATARAATVTSSSCRAEPADFVFIAQAAPHVVLALVERVRELEAVEDRYAEVTAKRLALVEERGRLLARIEELEHALGDVWELTNKADAALCEIISEGQRTFEIPSSPAWRDLPIGKARLMVTKADDVLRAALRALVPR